MSDTVQETEYLVGKGVEGKTTLHPTSTTLIKDYSFEYQFKRAAVIGAGAMFGALTTFAILFSATALLARLVKAVLLP